MATIEISFGTAWRLQPSLRAPFPFSRRRDKVSPGQALQTMQEATTTTIRDCKVLPWVLQSLAPLCLHSNRGMIAPLRNEPDEMTTVMEVTMAMGAARDINAAS